MRKRLRNGVTLVTLVTLSEFCVPRCESDRAMTAGAGHVSQLPRSYLQLWPGRSWNWQTEKPLHHHGKYCVTSREASSDFPRVVRCECEGPTQAGSVAMWVMLMSNTQSRAESTRALGPLPSPRLSDGCSAQMWRQTSDISKDASETFLAHAGARVHHLLSGNRSNKKINIKI